MIQLVLGGARSGKSRYAEQCLAAEGQPCVYLATAVAGDAEMAARIAHHQQQRQAAAINWTLQETPLALAEALTNWSGTGHGVLVDCLTLWLTNQLLAGADMAAVRQQLLQRVSQFDGTLVLVSNEVGSGIVPLGELSRRFVDEAGWLNQALAAVAQRVTLVVAGIPIQIKAL